MKLNRIILYFGFLLVLFITVRSVYAETENRASGQQILIPPGLAVCYLEKGDKDSGKSLEGQKYPVYQALDNDLATTWVANDQVALFEFLPCHLKKIDIVLGYTKSDNLYRLNKRPGIIGYRLWSYSEDNNHPQPITDWIKVALSSPGVIPKSDEIFTQIPLAMDTAYITAIELKVIKGIPEKAKSDDICISEIRFYGIPKGYKSGDSIIAESDDWMWPDSVIPGVDLEGDRLSYYFDLIDNKFHRFIHQRTGGATSTFHGSSRKVKSGYHLKGKIVTSSSGIIDEKENFDQIIHVIHINPFIVLIDGHLFVRKQTLGHANLP